MQKPAQRLRGFGLYLFATRLVCPLVPMLLRQRLKKGKEIEGRWREKLGEATQPRPDGPLIWLHAVGLGETLALRGLIAQLEDLRPSLNILVTSVTRGSAEAVAMNGIGGAIHQFLPADCPKARARFFDHWRPDYAVWSEQDIWPGLVHGAAERAIAQAWVNARMNAKAQAQRAKAARLYRAVFSCFSFISAQDSETAEAIAAFGCTASVDGSLKAAAPPLADAPAERTRIRAAIGAQRRVWMLASGHAEDEAVALEAYQNAGAADLLILAPRYVERGPQIAQTCAEAGLVTARRSAGEALSAQTQVYIADTLGEMGLWYRLAEFALIGGSHSAIEGHNPWESAALDCAILHGARTANFRGDYAALDGADAARPVAGAQALQEMLQAPDRAGTMARAAERAAGLLRKGTQDARALAERLLADMDAAEARRR